MTMASRIGMRKPTPPGPPRPPGRPEWIAHAVAQGMTVEDARSVGDEPLRRWFEEDDDQ